MTLRSTHHTHVCESHVVFMWERQGFLVTPELVLNQNEDVCCRLMSESVLLVCLLSRPGVTAHNFSTDRQYKVTTPRWDEVCVRTISLQAN